MEREAEPDDVAVRQRRRYAKPGEVSYWAVHRRLRSERGAPSEQCCVDCGATAALWSYGGGDPGEVTDRRTGWAYSTDVVGRYQPRCRSCQRKADWATRDRAPLDPQVCLMHYRDGMSLRSIGRMFGYNALDVRQLLVGLGEPIRARSTPFGRNRRWSR